MNFNNELRYHLIPEAMSVLDTLTREVNKPACWQDLELLYCYRVNRGQMAAAQQLLAELFVGGMPVTQMKLNARMVFPARTLAGMHKGVSVECR